MTAHLYETQSTSLTGFNADKPPDVPVFIELVEMTASRDVNWLTVELA